MLENVGPDELSTALAEARWDVAPARQALLENADADEVLIALDDAGWELQTSLSLPEVSMTWLPRCSPRPSPNLQPLCLLAPDVIKIWGEGTGPQKPFMWKTMPNITNAEHRRLRREERTSMELSTAQQKGIVPRFKSEYISPAETIYEADDMTNAERQRRFRERKRNVTVLDDERLARFHQPVIAKSEEVPSAPPIPPARDEPMADLTAVERAAKYKALRKSLTEVAPPTGDDERLARFRGRVIQPEPVVAKPEVVPEVPIAAPPNRRWPSWKGLLLITMSTILAAGNLSQTFMYWLASGGALAAVIGPPCAVINFIGLASLADLWRQGNRRFAVIATAGWLACWATDVYSTFGLLSQRFADSEAGRTAIISERHRLQAIIDEPFKAPADAARKAAESKVRAAEENRKAECEPIRGPRCQGLVAAEQKARDDLGAAIKGYDDALRDARAKHDAAIDQAQAQLAALPVIAAPEIAMPTSAKLALSIVVLAVFPGIGLRWGLALLRR